MMVFIVGILFIMLGVKVIVTKEIMGRGIYFDLNSPFLYYPIGIFFILFGLLILWSLIKRKK